MSDNLKQVIAVKSDEEWLKFMEAEKACGTFVKELPNANFMGNNFSNYYNKVMLLPEVDMGDFAVDRNGDRYFRSGLPAYSGYICKFFPEILDKLRKFSYILGPGNGGKVELLGRVKEVFNWWNNYVFIDTVAIRIPNLVTVFFEDGKAAFVGEDLIEARLAELKVESAADIPLGLKAIPTGTPPETIAKLFYHLCVNEDNQEVWMKLLAKDCFWNGKPESKVSSWWNLMKKGRSYYFVRIADDEEDRKKYFFQMQLNGVDTSSPNPITVVKEDGEWRVQTANP